jgi:hypothetical protein
MNYDLAIMALEGIARSPLRVTAAGDEVIVEASSATFKELARLCLLLGGTHTPEDAFDLEPGMHVTEGSPTLRLRLTEE